MVLNPGDNIIEAATTTGTTLTDSCLWHLTSGHD